MITADGRSGIEAEMEHMHLTRMDLGEQPMEIGYRDHAGLSGAGADDLLGVDRAFARLSRWLGHLFSPIQA